VLGRALRTDNAILHVDGVVGGVAREVHVVLHDEHGHALVGQLRPT
jgi:hypothetical protein